MSVWYCSVTVSLTGIVLCQCGIQCHCQFNRYCVMSVLYKVSMSV